MDLSNYLTLGTIVKTRGLDGTFKVKSSTYFADERYQENQKMFIYLPESDTLKEVSVADYYPEGEYDYVTFNEIDNITAAEKYLKGEILVSLSDIKPLPDGMYYYHQLKGLNVFDENDDHLGEVLEVVDYTAQPSFRVRLNNKKIILIPFVEFFVKKIDLSQKKMIIHVIEGLLG